MIRVVYSADSKTGLFLGLKPGHPVNEEVLFFRECASPLERALLQQHMTEYISALFREVRRTSYLSGWRDAKSKKLKRDFFSGMSEVVEWEKKQAGL